MTNPELFVSIVTWNSARFLNQAIGAAQKARSAERIKFLVVDNASQDNSAEIATSHGIEVVRLSSNQGFCGGQNEAVRIFLQSSAHSICFMNPDIMVKEDTWENIFKSLHENPSAAAITPKLLRINEDFSIPAKKTIDAAGMILTPSLRHLDRGSEEIDNGQYEHTEYVFGGTGAFLIVRKEAVNRLLLPRISESTLQRVIPELRGSERPQLFDEAFFAFREDADLAWRMKGTKLQFLYDPHIQAYHVRKVTPQRRWSLPPALNSASVRNRFLLQVNNWSFSEGFESFVKGILFRNIIVVIGVILREQSSLRGLMDFVALLPRALKMRWAIQKIRKELQ